MQLADLEARGRLTAELVDITDTDAVVDGLRRRRAGLAGVAHQPGARGRRHPGDHGGRPRRRRLRRRRQHLRHSAAAAAARARRRPRRALGDQVPRRAQRRAARRRRHPRRRAVRRAQGPPRPDRRDPRHARGVAGAARPAHPAPAGRARPGQRPGAGAPARASTRPSARSATPASAAIVAIVLAEGALAADLLTHKTEAVGARHLARRRGVDLRAAPPLEDRARHHPRRRWCGCRSASRTSTTSGPTSSSAATRLTSRE